MPRSGTHQTTNAASARFSKEARRTPCPRPELDGCCAISGLARVATTLSSGCISRVGRRTGARPSERRARGLLQSRMMEFRMRASHAFGGQGGLAAAVFASLRAERIRVHDDHRLPRPLHHRACGARCLSPGADRRVEGPVGRAQGTAEDQRRPDPRQPGRRPAQAAACPRHRCDDLQPARFRDGASHRHRGDQPGLVAAVQRPDRARGRSLS